MTTHWHRFIRWFYTPIETLRGIPRGDGAFAAFSLSLSLYERFIRCDLKYNKGVKANDEAFRKAGAEDLKLTEDEFEGFWNVYRHGINHQGSPKKFKSFNWEISDSFDGTPAFRSEADASTTILIDPWKFWDYVFHKYEQQPDILAKSDTHAFGDIY